MHNKKNLPLFAYLENTFNVTETSYYFSNPQDEVLCTSPLTLSTGLQKILTLQQQGLYLVGFISYEAGYYLNPDFLSLQKNNSSIDKLGTPLIHFVAFEKCSTKKPLFNKNQVFNDQAVIDLICDPLTHEQYSADFAVLKEALINGESYQINYTKRLQLRSSFDSLSLYEKLQKQQPVSYSAFLPYVPMKVLSFSPELFFYKKGNSITVKPMKGTSARFHDPTQDDASYNFLQNDPKNKAENLIIIDLLRNDLARICHIGSIKVKNPFKIEAYKSVYQMTSTVCGKVDIKIPFSKIIEKLFPCGSITGAPKKRTMEIIQKIEPLRHLYTGCIGYIMPNNDMCFSVAIRTLTQENDKLWDCGVGGGFTIQSTQKDEWQEMTTKINFIKHLYEPRFKLIETMLYNDRGLQSCSVHLDRLMHSGWNLHFSIDIVQIKDSLLKYCSRLTTIGKQQYKIRLEVDHKSYFNISHKPLIMEDIIKVELFVCPEQIDSQNFLWQHKTTDQSTRGFYTNTYNKYLHNTINKELVYTNELKNITESCFYNLIIELNGIFFTPPVTDGLLPGIRRAKLIDSGELVERSITIDELKNATNIYLINDIRGKVAAFLNINTTQMESLY